jgi:hypothetical protein
MKKTFTLLSLLSVGTLMFGQTARTKAPALTATKNHGISQRNAMPSLGAANKVASPQSLVWSDDFSVSSNWTKTSPTGPGLWSVGTTGPTGSYSIAAINSTSQANGFAKFDSDVDCSGDEIADITTAGVINCTGHPFVMLEFQQQYRRFYDSTFVFVSGDNGTSYTKFVVNENLGNNDFCSTNPEVVKIDISSVAGNMPQVKVRFQFYSPSSLAGAPGCAYAWMVDDVSIYDLPTNDVAISRAYSDMMYTNGGYYTQIPNTQTMPITFRGAIENRGSAAQTNVMLNVDINNGSGSVYNQNSNTLASLSYKAKDTLSIATPYVMSTQNGTYTTTFHVSQNETEAGPEVANSTVVKAFSVTDTIFARDNGVQTDYTSPNLYTGGDAGSEIGNVYEISTNAVANSVSVFLNAGTDPGTEIVANIYKLNLNGSFDIIGSSAPYQINSAADADKWVTLSTSGVPLDADSTYLVSILTGGNISTSAPTSRVLIGVDKVTQQPEGTTLLYLIADDTWYLLTDLPMIRLNIVNTITGVKDLDQNNGVTLGQNIPNPFTKESTVSYQLATDANSAVFTVTDVMGRVISTEKAGTSKGAHSIKLGSYAAGLYYYSLNVDGKVSTRKMIVE